ncbi:MAG: hypothetical protein LBO69_04250 [Ignavibacteria bacterium]|jgi:cell division protease FtsH|nr:hypothetical protein [Ignavibacteria bacterium]
MKNSEFSASLSEKQTKLKNAVAQLKQEFVGIDCVIDQIADTIVSWYYFPEMQEKPVLINLWGLTGIGKTSLVKRLVELLDYKNFYFHFDLGEPSQNKLVREFRQINDSCNGKPFIIGMDEFQFARTIDERGMEKERKDFWELLDSGKFDLIDFSNNICEFREIIDLLKLALNNNVQVSNGIVVNGKKEFTKILKEIKIKCWGHYDEEEDNNKKDKNKMYFISDMLIDYSRRRFVEDNTIFNSDLRDKFNKMDGQQTVNYLEELYENDLAPKVVDCSKSLIFVMGNLDEVYSMTKNFDPDISANDFHEQSKLINITDVKDALLKRFRSEQIARLGNNHIIYPTFSENSFYKIIKLELEKISKKINDLYGINIQFDKSIEKLIYCEGVYPTQGTRPVFTTVYQIINARLGRILTEIFVEKRDIDLLIFSVENPDFEKEFCTLKIDCIKNNVSIHNINDIQQLTLGKLREPKNNDLQVISAVHESGHAVISIILQKVIPETIVSVSANSNTGGFTIIEDYFLYTSKKNLTHRVAVLLGGTLAERLIFGEENATMGGSKDIEIATERAYHAFYECGANGKLLNYGNQYASNKKEIIYTHSNSEINEEVKKFIVDTQELAMEILQKQKTLLLKLSVYLSKNRSIGKEEIMDFVKQYAIEFNTDKIIDEEKNSFYKQCLMGQLEGNAVA